MAISESCWTISEVFLKFKKVHWKNSTICEMQKSDPGPHLLNSFTAVLDKIGLNISPKKLWCRMYWGNLWSLPNSSRCITTISWKFWHLMIYLHKAQSAQIFCINNTKIYTSKFLSKNDYKLFWPTEDMDKNNFLTVLFLRELITLCVCVCSYNILFVYLFMTHWVIFILFLV